MKGEKYVIINSIQFEIVLFTLVLHVHNTTGAGIKLVNGNIYEHMSCNAANITNIINKYMYIGWNGWDEYELWDENVIVCEYFCEY